MAKYLVLLKINRDIMPADPREYAKLLIPMLNMTKKDLKEGAIKDWGMYVGENKGYAISEQTPEELAMVATQMAPYVSFEVHQVLSLSELEKTFKSMMPATK
jgi:hypothetical protein